MGRHFREGRCSSRGEIFENLCRMKLIAALYSGRSLLHNLTTHSGNDMNNPTKTPYNYQHDPGISPYTEFYIQDSILYHEHSIQTLSTRYASRQLHQSALLELGTSKFKSPAKISFAFNVV